MEFPKFWYDSNACWGQVDSFMELMNKANLQIAGGSAIRTLDHFLDRSKRSKQLPEESKNVYDFGTGQGYDSGYTLRQFLQDNGVLEDFIAFYHKNTHKLTPDYLKGLGFSEVTTLVLGAEYHIVLKKRLKLAIASLGKGNEMVFLVQKNTDTEGIDPKSDVLAIHNFDYDGFLTKEKLGYLLKFFEK